MSYILDALKKADAERERDAAVVPDLHAQGDAAVSDRSSGRLSGWALLALVASSLALVVLVWRWLGAAPADAAPPAVTAEAAVPAPAPLAIQAARPAPPAMSPATMPAMPPPAPATAVSRASPMPAPPRAAVPRPPALPAALPATPAAKPAAATAAAAKPATPASAASETRLPTLAELPADLRGQLPALAVGGSVYSPKPSSRIVILNGQVFREGDKPIEGLMVEQIRLKSTVLAFRGVRFELKH